MTKRDLEYSVFLNDPDYSKTIEFVRNYSKQNKEHHWNFDLLNDLGMRNGFDTKFNPTGDRLSLKYNKKRVLVLLKDRGLSLSKPKAGDNSGLCTWKTPADYFAQIAQESGEPSENEDWSDEELKASV
jgi:hypothetical protein